MQCCDVFMFVMFFCCQTNFPTGTIKLDCIVLYKRFLSQGTAGSPGALFLTKVGASRRERK